MNEYRDALARSDDGAPAQSGDVDTLAAGDAVLLRADLTYDDTSRVTSVLGVEGVEGVDVIRRRSAYSHVHLVAYHMSAGTEYVCEECWLLGPDPDLDDNHGSHGSSFGGIAGLTPRAGCVECFLSGADTCRDCDLTGGEVLAHLAAHRQAGHDVPSWVDQRVQKEEQ
jgi:hypothetical protein